MMADVGRIEVLAGSVYSDDDMITAWVFWFLLYKAFETYCKAGEYISEGTLSMGATGISDSFRDIPFRLVNTNP